MAGPLADPRIYKPRLWGNAGLFAPFAGGRGHVEWFSVIEA